MVPGMTLSSEGNHLMWLCVKLYAIPTRLFQLWLRMGLRSTSQHWRVAGSTAHGVLDPRCCVGPELHRSYRRAEGV